MEFNLRFDGADELKKNTAFVISSMPSILEKATVAAAILVEGTAKGYIAGSGVDEFQEKAFALNGNTYLAASSLRRISGMLANSITHKVLAGSTGVEATIGTNLLYGRIHELGGIIRAKNSPFLVFKTEDGMWHRVKSVEMPARPFLMPALLSNEKAILNYYDETFWSKLKEGGIQ